MVAQNSNPQSTFFELNCLAKGWTKETKMLLVPRSKCLGYCKLKNTWVCGEPPEPPLSRPRLSKSTESQGLSDYADKLFILGFIQGLHLMLSIHIDEPISFIAPFYM